MYFLSSYSITQWFECEVFNKNAGLRMTDFKIYFVQTLNSNGLKNSQMAGLYIISFTASSQICAETLRSVSSIHSTRLCAETLRNVSSIHSTRPECFKPHLYFVQYGYRGNSTERFPHCSLLMIILLSIMQ